MQALITSDGQQFGPHTTIIATSDRFICDDSIEIPFSVAGVGAHIAEYVPVIPVPNAAALSAQAIADLAAIDLKSIRGLREWVAAQGNAPKVLTDLENQAVATRKHVAKG